jgi:hypothetical protein
VVVLLVVELVVVVPKMVLVVDVEVDVVVWVVSVVVLVLVAVVVVLVVVVVTLVVVVVGPHGGSAGFVQEQNVSPLTLHWSRTNFLQALKSAPDKVPHEAWISSAHCFEPQSGGAALGPETKTPAPSATAANVTTALRVIVGPPHGRSLLRSISAL